MAKNCVSCGSGSSLLYCSCAPDLLYCDWCFSLHSRGRPEHSSYALESRTQMCNSCREKQSMWLCVCDYPWRELCSLCSPIHVEGNHALHYLEPVQAKYFLRTPQDIPAYVQRQRLVKDFEARIYANIRQLNVCKTDLDCTYLKLKAKLDEWHQTCKDQLQDVSQRVTKAMDEALKQLQSRRFSLFQRPTNRLDFLLLRPESAVAETDFTFVRLTPFPCKLEAVVVEENYELLAEGDYTPLQDLTLG